MKDTIIEAKDIHTRKVTLLIKEGNFNPRAIILDDNDEDTIYIYEDMIVPLMKVLAEKHRENRGNK